MGIKTTLRMYPMNPNEEANGAVFNTLQLFFFTWLLTLGKEGFAFFVNMMSGIWPALLE
jgi:hypothetical protein